MGAGADFSVSGKLAASVRPEPVVGSGSAPSLRSGEGWGEGQRRAAAIARPQLLQMATNGQAKTQTNRQRQSRQTSGK